VIFLRSWWQLTDFLDTFAILQPREPEKAFFVSSGSGSEVLLDETSAVGSCCFKTSFQAVRFGYYEVGARSAE